MSLNCFDAIFYINLEHRKDRNSELLSQLKKMDADPKKIFRIPALYDPLNGTRGCAQSHIIALETALNRSLNNVLILEDDCSFQIAPAKIQKELIAFFSTFKNEWDVLLLGANVAKFTNTPYKKFKRVLSAQCAHSYAVNGHYLKTLLSCFRKALKKMKGQSYYFESIPFAIDQEWKKLQPKGKWYIGKMLTFQSFTFSDIELTIRRRKHSLNIAEAEKLKFKPLLHF